MCDVSDVASCIKTTLTLARSDAESKNLVRHFGRLMPDPMMVRLAVSSPDSPPLSGSTQVLATNNASSPINNSYDAVVQPTTTPPAQASVSPSQQNSHQMAPNIPPGAIPLNQMSPHHMPPYHHHPHSGGNGHIHDHNNGHHHNGLYLGPAYANEFYPAGADAPPHGAYFIPPEMCPAHTQLCTVHPEYGKKSLLTADNRRRITEAIIVREQKAADDNHRQTTPLFTRNSAELQHRVQAKRKWLLDGVGGLAGKLLFAFTKAVHSLQFVNERFAG